MEPETAVFALPTCPLKDVVEAISVYGTNFWCNDHKVKLMVFDAASVANQVKNKRLENHR